MSLSISGLSSHPHSFPKKESSKFAGSMAVSPEKGEIHKAAVRAVVNVFDNADFTRTHPPAPPKKLDESTKTFLQPLLEILQRISKLLMTVIKQIKSLLK